MVNFFENFTNLSKTLKKTNSVMLVYGCSIDIIHGMCNGIAKPN
jgi:hypothetical protein